MNESGFPMTVDGRIRLWAHDNALFRRLAWRFELPGFAVENRKIAEFEADEAISGEPDSTVHIVDLGWSGAEIESSMTVVFALTQPVAARPRAASVIVLAPRFDPATRPAWAELGVWLVLDRTTPPPEIVEVVIRLMRGRNLFGPQPSFEPESRTQENSSGGDTITS